MPLGTHGTVPAFAGPPASTMPSGVDLVRGLVGRLNAEHASEQDVGRFAEHIQAVVEGARIDCQYDAEEHWWSIDAHGVEQPARCTAKLTHLEDGRWRLWLASGVVGSEDLIPACALAVEFVEALRARPDEPDVVAQELAARTGAHISLASGRLSVTLGRRCRGLVAADDDGLAALFLVDGDAWTGAPSPTAAPARAEEHEA